MISLLIAVPLQVTAEPDLSTSVVATSDLQPVWLAMPDARAGCNPAARYQNAYPPTPQPLNGEKNHPDLITRLEKIPMYGRNAPEDFVGAQHWLLMQFRARLENEVSLSAAKKAQRTLCFIG